MSLEDRPPCSLSAFCNTSFDVRVTPVDSGVVPIEAEWVTRRGELLRGPLYYVLVLMAATTVYWRESPVGVVAFSLMCAPFKYDSLGDCHGNNPYAFVLSPSPFAKVSSSLHCHAASCTMSEDI